MQTWFEETEIREKNEFMIYYKRCLILKSGFRI